MFGFDNMVWPQAIEHGIQTINRAPVLTTPIPAPDRTANKRDGLGKLKQKIRYFQYSYLIVYQKKHSSRVNNLKFFWRKDLSEREKFVNVVIGMLANIHSATLKLTSIEEKKPVDLPRIRKLTDKGVDTFMDEIEKLK